ncbi:hypothetical protein AYO38_09110 [bacterium SCGC AG-212-C10]|nr:hypothetical protein AYO38_09110 [bacterium SCGC AG-212-C10]
MLSRWASTTFGALRYRDFRILWIGSSISFLGFMMSFVVSSVVAFDLTGKNAAVGLVGLGQGVASILLSPIGGVVADRVSKRLLVLVGQVAIGLTFLTTGILIVGDWITIPLLVGSMFMLGVVFAFIGPARQAWLGDLLPREAMPNGVALQQISMTGTRIIGPLTAGILVGVAFVGSGGTYIFMGSLFVFVIATTLMLPKTKARQDAQRKSVAGDMKLGISHVTGRPRLALLVLTFIGIVLLGFSWQVLLPGLLENELGHSPKHVGWLMTASAISGLAMTLGMAGYAGTRHAWRIMFGAAIVLGVSLILMGWAPSYAAALVVMLGVGAGGGVFQMMNNSLVMQQSEPEYFGRVMSLTMMAWGFNGLAGLPFGIMADGMGERQTLVLMGVLVMVATMVAAFAHLVIDRRAAGGTVLAARVAGGK